MPKVECENVSESKWDGEDTEQDVADGEVRDEDVPRRQHLLEIETLGLKKDFFSDFCPMHSGQFILLNNV